MYDINNHPAREKLNKEIGTVLGKTIRELYKISKRYNVDRKEVIEQFEISMRLFTEKGEQVMSIGKEVTEGMMGAFLMDGVEIQRIDFDNNVLYILIPRDSYSYGRGEIKCAEDYAKNIKRVFIELGIFDINCSVRYKVKDIYWTKEMGDKNFNENIGKVLEAIARI